MPELCLSSTPNKTATKFSTLLLTDLAQCCSFVLSHPLYFAYIIFFSPYLLKLLSFLSPLFITTALLLLGFLTVSPLKVSESQAGFLLSTYHTVRERLWSTTENEEEFPPFEEFEAYKIIFDSSALCALENSDEVPESRSEENLVEKTVEIAWEEKRVEGLVKEFENLGNMTLNEEEKKVEFLSLKFNEVKKEVSVVGSESEATGGCGNLMSISKKVSVVGSEYEATGGKLRDEKVEISTNRDGEYTPDKPLESPSLQTLESNLGSYGSMRKEKEWKRTLACKLFEERHNVGGGEGMDSLWEAYENDSSKAKAKGNNAKKKKNKKSVYHEEEEDYEDEDEDGDGQLCCLQALKFSSGRMNFGMRKPSLMKISKAIKGFGWLHNVTRHGRKG